MGAEFEIYHCLETAMDSSGWGWGYWAGEGEMGYSGEDRTESRSGKRQSVTSGIIDL